MVVRAFPVEMSSSVTRPSMPPVIARFASWELNSKEILPAACTSATGLPDLKVLIVSGDASVAGTSRFLRFVSSSVPVFVRRSSASAGNAAPAAAAGRSTSMPAGAPAAAAGAGSW
jgi:hypothetical protein